MKDKRGQVTIFIIIGLLIVAGVLIFFVWVQPSLDFRGSTNFGFEGCVTDSVSSAVAALEKTTGLGESGFTYQYKGESIPYVCYTNNFYETCTVQQPFLKQNFERALKEMIQDNVQSCYDESVGSLQAQGYEVKRGEVSYDALLEPSLIRVPVEAPTQVETRQFTKVNVEINSPIYEMLFIATTIVQQEAQLGDSDTDTLMANYPDYLVLKFKRDDGTTIYTITSKLFGNKMQFASRSLPWPAGFDQ